MVPGDHPEAVVGVASGRDESANDAAESANDAAESHWLRWHGAYDDPRSPLSERLRRVQEMVRGALDDMAPGRDRGQPIRIISLCAGQGRDVIDVLATHPRAPEVEALLVELDPALAEFARRRAAEAGLEHRVRVEQGDASLCHWYAGSVPADLVLVCGIFGNISGEDICGHHPCVAGVLSSGGQRRLDPGPAVAGRHPGHPGRVRRRRVH